MVVIKSSLLARFPEIVFGFSTKKGGDENPPYYFNLSLSVGDDENKVIENRRKFYKSLGLQLDQIAFQKQVHSGIITYIDKPGFSCESDAMITDKPGIGLAISVADCTPVFIYDSKQKIIAAIHSGWRGTIHRIVENTVFKLKSEFNSHPKYLNCYIGPSISQPNYEVGPEVAEQFDERYLMPVNGKFLLDVRTANQDMLIESGIPANQIQVSNLCTYANSTILHSYRKDGQISGRAYGVIALKGKA